MLLNRFKIKNGGGTSGFVAKADDILPEVPKKSTIKLDMQFFAEKDLEKQYIHTNYMPNVPFCITKCIARSCMQTAVPALRWGIGTTVMCLQDGSLRGYCIFFRFFIRL